MMQSRGKAYIDIHCAFGGNFGFFFFFFFCVLAGRFFISHHDDIVSNVNFQNRRQLLLDRAAQSR